MNITRFSNDSLNRISQHLDVALATVRDQLGLDIKIGNCRYTNNTATLKLEIKTIEKDGKAFDEDAANFKVFADKFGLQESDLGREFIHNFSKYKISGLKPRNTKYPIIVQRVKDNKTFRFPIRLIQKLLKETV